MSVCVFQIDVLFASKESEGEMEGSLLVLPVNKSNLNTVSVPPIVSTTPKAATAGHRVEVTLVINSSGRIRGNVAGLLSQVLHSFDYSDWGRLRPRPIRDR